MKILVVAPSLRRGGAERAVSRLTQAWSRDHRVSLVLFNTAEQAYPYGGDLVDLAAPPARGFLGKARTVIARTLSLRRLLLRLEPDRVFGFMESAGIPLILAALLSGYRRKITLSVRGNPDRMGFAHKVLVFLLYRWAGGVVAVSRGAAERLAGFFAGPAVRVVYSPLDLDPIAANAGRREEAVAVPGESPYFFAAGRLVPGKDFERMIRIFAGSDCGDAHLLIAGEGPERPRLESRIHRGGLSHRVHLIGETDNPFVYMKSALAFLMTSQHEGFPMVLIESLASGCPVIAFDCDFGPREVTEDGACGFIVPVHDDGLFARRLAEIAADPALRNGMSVRALRRAGDFEIQKVAEQWLRV